MAKDCDMKGFEFALTPGETTAPAPAPAPLTGFTPLSPLDCERERYELD